jgi:hypothetical protein
MTGSQTRTMDDVFRFTCTPPSKIPITLPVAARPRKSIIRYYKTQGFTPYPLAGSVGQHTDLADARHYFGVIGRMDGLFAFHRIRKESIMRYLSATLCGLVLGAAASSAIAQPTASPPGTTPPTTTPPDTVPLPPTTPPGTYPPGTYPPGTTPPMNNPPTTTPPSATAPPLYTPPTTTPPSATSPPANAGTAVPPPQ